jgi:hypothetical protein
MSQSRTRVHRVLVAAVAAAAAAAAAAACGGGGTPPAQVPALPAEGAGSGSGAAANSGAAASSREAPPPAPVVERWSGTLLLPTGLRDLAVRFSREGGAWTATLDVPDAGLAGAKLTDVALSADTIRFTLAKGGAPEADERYAFTRRATRRAAR